MKNNRIYRKILKYFYEHISEECLEISVIRSWFPKIPKQTIIDTCLHLEAEGYVKTGIADAEIYDIYPIRSEIINFHKSRNPLKRCYSLVKEIRSWF